LRTSSEQPLVVTVDTCQRRQTIDSFGASDAWSIQYVGAWPDAKRRAIADLLFEPGLDDANNPVGIALSSWRFNIGAGSTRQNNISDRWRRADTFLSSDFTGYDWSRLPGQRWFLQAAKARGVERFTAFVNSPPINMTRNGKAYCSSDSGTTNLRDDCVDDFADYLAKILLHFAEAEGIVFEYISPFNEPNWDWNGAGQEGCRYDNSDIRRVVDALDSELRHSGLGTKTELPEAGEIGYLYGQSSERGDYVDSLFDPLSPHYIGSKVAYRVAGHSYFTCWPEDNRLVGWRRGLRNKLDAYPGLKYTMSEYCIYIPSGSWVPPQYWGYGNGRDLGMGPALWMARVIHHDLTVAEASTWQWWLAVSAYDYKDGLVYVDKSEANGGYYESKMLWAMGNFSRFIRPQMIRVKVNRSDNAAPEDTVRDLMVSGYYRQDDGTVVAVFVNWAEEDKPVQLRFIGTEIASLIPYVTRANSLGGDNLTAYRGLSPLDTMAIPARSVVTIVGLPPDRRCDLNRDYHVNLDDLVLWAVKWLWTGPPGGIAEDLTADGVVDLADFASLAQDWLDRWNRAPVVGITVPADGAVIGLHPSIPLAIEANAGDLDGWVEKVEFYADGNPVGQDNSPIDGWKAAWSDHSQGNHVLTARATDNEAMAASSPVVRVTVTKPPR
jgi:O-glycosyl hydrolase